LYNVAIPKKIEEEKRMKKIISLLLVLVMVLGLVACGNKAPAADAPAADAPAASPEAGGDNARPFEGRTLTIAHGHHAYADAYNAQFAAFEEKYGCTIQIDLAEGYPPLVNKPEIFKLCVDAVTAAGIPFKERTEPSLGGEDFAYYLQEVPGAFLDLGTGFPQGLHTIDFQMDESTLATGVKAFCALLQMPL
jgi:predicted small lipoprotein YifL